MFPPPRAGFHVASPRSPSTGAKGIGASCLRPTEMIAFRRFPPLGRPRRGCSTQRRRRRVGGQWENKRSEGGVQGGASFVFLLPLHHLRQLRHIPSGVSARACRLGPALCFSKGNRFVRQISRMEICVHNKKAASVQKSFSFFSPSDLLKNVFFSLFFVGTVGSQI